MPVAAVPRVTTQLTLALVVPAVGREQPLGEILELAQLPTQAPVRCRLPVAETVVTRIQLQATLERANHQRSLPAAAVVGQVKGQRGLLQAAPVRTVK